MRARTPLSHLNARPRFNQSEGRVLLTWAATPIPNSVFLTVNRLDIVGAEIVAGFFLLAGAAIFASYYWFYRLYHPRVRNPETNSRIPSTTMKIPPSLRSMVNISKGRTNANETNPIVRHRAANCGRNLLDFRRWTAPTSADAILPIRDEKLVNASKNTRISLYWWGKRVPTPDKLNSKLNFSGDCRTSIKPAKAMLPSTPVTRTDCL